MIEDIESVICTNIRIARKSKGLSLNMLAQQLGYSETNLSNIEHKRIRLSAADMYRISVICDVDIKDLYDPNFSLKHMGKKKVASDYDKAIKKEKENIKIVKVSHDKRFKKSNLTQNRLSRAEL